MPTLLKDLRINEVSSVDRGAGEGVKIMLMKREFSADERRAAAASGEALPDGCLSGDTLVETVSGPKPIANLIGPCKVLTDLGWRDADIRCFGIQRLVEIDFQRGQDRRVILATLGHRWYSERGVVLTGDLVAGDAVPHVSRDAFDAECFDPSERRIAASAEQSAHSASSVVVIDKERRPEPTARSMGALSYGLLAANRAAAVLGGNHTIEVVVGDIVLAPQDTVAARQPARVTDLDFGAGFVGVGALAKLAFRSEATVAPIEVGSRALNLAETANEARRGFFDQWGNRLHIPHNIEPWRVNQVRLTELVEPVFCAVVPGAHRFALAGGLLTGNSFPIKTVGDLENAVRAYGRAKDPAKAKAHIISRARSLGATDKLPDDWLSKGDHSMTEEEKKAKEKAEREEKEKAEKEEREKAEKAAREKAKKKPKGEIDSEDDGENEAEKNGMCKALHALKKMSPKHRQYFDNADFDDDEASKFLRMKPEDRDAHIAENPDPHESASPAIKKALADAVVMKAEFAKMQEEREVAKFEKRAVAIGLPEVAGETLRKAYAGDATAIAKLEQTIKGLTAQVEQGALFKEFGSTGAKAATAKAEVLAKADELRKANPKMSEASAFTKVYTDPTNAELKKRYDAEEWATRRSA